jgi:heme/copper-type cytochrome/quinol oxidase subunit 2
MCGIGHGMMPAELFIETAEQHTAWMADHAPKSLAAVSAP